MHQVSTFKKIMGWILLSSLLLAGACATGGLRADRTTSSPEDPMFWQMWQDRYGGSD
jgi:hypothetical protein